MDESADPFSPRGRREPTPDLDEDAALLDGEPPGGGQPAPQQEANNGHSREDWLRMLEEPNNTRRVTVSPNDVGNVVVAKLGHATTLARSLAFQGENPTHYATPIGQTH